METSDDASSDLSDTILDNLNDNELSRLKTPIVEEHIEDLSSEDEPTNTPLTSEDGSPRIKARPYQTEMVEESLKRNIIVAMDTGSGKTHVAILRMKAELERMTPHQIIWFLAPTKPLCSQQHEYIESQISFVQSKVLSGDDNVDSWSERSWHSVLKNIKIVVSPPQILFDALAHAFVKMNSLALIVFDEAHNCVGKNSGAKIMQSFYHKRKAQGLHVPHILGLTASPVMRSKATSVFKIEQTLDSLCRTPTKHRAELRLQVNLPVLSEASYDSSLLGTSRSVIRLQRVLEELKLEEDPYYLHLRGANDDRSRRQFQKLMLDFKTKSREQLKSFLGTALKICADLGTWAADYYVSEVVSRVTNTEGATRSNSELRVEDAETLYLTKTMNKVNSAATPFPNISDLQAPVLSDKVAKLIQVLLLEPDSSIGIVFVQERATAAVLAHLLSVHPLTREKFRVRTFVGTSTSNLRRTRISDLINLESNKHTLLHFKTGRANLVIATSVLEEGIDVPACNLVICFEKPSNLKSFVQRRGRARRRDSKLVLLVDTGDSNNIAFHQLEADMRAIYEDEMRTLQEGLVNEDSEESDHRTYTVESTGAVLDFDQAVSHLYHFCATLPITEYVDLRPDFICNREGNLIKAKVILPLSVNEGVRTAESRSLWKSEKNAIKDACFEAYIALHKAGLLSDNLLPLLNQTDVLDDLKTKASDTRASIVTVKEQECVWFKLARSWGLQTEFQVQPDLYRSTVTIDALGMDLILPLDLQHPVPGFSLYWDRNTELQASSGTLSKIKDRGIVDQAQQDTRTLLRAAYGHRFPIRESSLVVPFLANHQNLQQLLGATWTLDDYFDLEALEVGLIRDRMDPKIAYIFERIIPEKPALAQIQAPYDGYEGISKDTKHVSLTRLTKRSDFLHRDLSTKYSSKEFSMVLPVHRCKADAIPFKFVRFALMLPSILHRLEIYLLAHSLSEGILKPLGISDLRLVLEAICASSAIEHVNYQRLEFYGDAILKLCTSIQLMAKHPFYHEGYLSRSKDRVVSNRRLCNAALDAGLDQYIITKQFTALKWRPFYVEDFLSPPPDLTREMSTKVLADVVEALIGAAMTDGGFPKALTCLQIFVPELNWLPLEQRRAFLFERVPDHPLPITHEPVEELLGYKFNKKALLLEALTHASYNSGAGSWERVEFLGDAILDHLVVTAMLPYNLSHDDMHHLRTITVNADFLAFVCMELSTSEDSISLQEELRGGGLIFNEKHNPVEFPLWKFIRHMSPSMGLSRSSTAIRHAVHRSDIKAAIETGDSVPWTLLSRLNAQKFYSDIIEAVIGAVWIDSGSFDVCTQLVERMGILPYLRRLVIDKVQLLHPKEELGMLAVDLPVNYVLWTEKGDVDKGDEVELWCKVEVGDSVSVTVREGVSKEEVMAKAAEEACRMMKQKKAGSAEIIEMETNIAPVGNVSGLC